jgi:hypothetical protein
VINSPHIKQSLLFANMPDGTTYTLAVLADDQLAVLRDGVILETDRHCENGLDRAVDRFVAYTESPQQIDMKVR